jgi:glycosyltransferase involved in cell wall biosynthesis
LSEQAYQPGSLPQIREISADSNRLKVALVTAFPPSDGDLNEYGFHLACALQDDPRVDLTILADKTDKPEIGDFKVSRCWQFNSILNPVYLLSAIWKSRPDVVWFNIGFSTFARTPVAAFLAIFVPALARLSGYYTHITLHTVFERISLEDAGIRMPGLYKSAGRVATRLLLLANDVSVLLPSYQAELVKAYGSAAGRVQARPHGTFKGAQEFNIQPQPSAHLQNTETQLEDHSLKNQNKDQNKDQNKEKIILAFGYWGTYKRVDLLLESMDAIRSKVPNAVLVVAGTNHPNTPGYLEGLQRRWHGPAVRFLGYLAEDELPALFTSASVLVLPYSSTAGTSGVVHQACQFGLPMVAAEVPELVEIAREEGVAMEFYTQGDGKVLANQLIRLLSSNELRKKFSEQNLAAAQKTPMSQVIDDYVRLFQERVHFKNKVTSQ